MRHRFGARSEQLDPEQLQLGLEDAETALGQARAAGEAASPRSKSDRSRKSNRGSLPAHLERIEQVVDVEDQACPCCGGALHQIGEDVAERLDVAPTTFRVLVTRRPRYGCRSCESAVVQAPAPARIVEGGIPTEALIAQVLVAKYADHLPLYRQAQIYARQGIQLDRSTLADWVGPAAWYLRPLRDHILERLRRSERLFADETTAPVPGGGYNELYAAGRQPGSVLEAGCFAHARRKFFELADVEGAARKKSRGERTNMVYPIALEAVQKLDDLFAIERSVNGRSPAERFAARREFGAPLMEDLHGWLEAQLAKLSRNHDLAKAINYMHRRWPAFTRFLDDGRVCLSNNAAERALRCVPLGRKAWLFCGSDRGGDRAAVLYTLIQTARLNDVDPQAWLADVLARIADHPASQLGKLLPWNWNPSSALAQAA